MTPGLLIQLRGTDVWETFTALPSSVLQKQGRIHAGFLGGSPQCALSVCLLGTLFLETPSLVDGTGIGTEGCPDILLGHRDARQTGVTTQGGFRPWGVEL